MNILVAGATGQTGRRLLGELLDRGHHPIAMVRDGSDTSGLPPEVTLRKADLTDLQDDVCQGCDGVIFAAGSGGDTDESMTKKVDRDGAKRLIDIAAQSKVKRFIMLSSIGASDPDPDGDMAIYLHAKHDADAHLRSSGLTYSILRPVALTEEDGTRDMRFGDAVDPDAKAARGDVAAALAQALDDDAWINRTARMQSILPNDDN